MTAAAGMGRVARTAAVVGAVFDVTNHYITRDDHPCFGTRRGIVVRANSAAVYLTTPGFRGESRVAWPKAAQLRVDDDGSILLYGGGAGQKPDELFLTLRPVEGE